MKLLKLSLRNFKGIKEFTLDARSGNVSVFGDNATGKTTLFDAFTWLLFEKDSANKKDFQIKTLDANGNVIHHLEHEVEGILEIGGRTIKIKKVYAEKWTKKRGSATSEFTGHTTDYYVDDVPKPKKDYDKFIGEMADENIFKLLTNPLYFNEQLHWQEKRKLLLEICGDVSDAEVISSDVKLKKLPDILQGRTLEDHRKMIQSQQAAINKELKEIPARIDEVSRSLPETISYSREGIEIEIASLKKQQQAKQQEIVRIENGGEIAERQKALREIEGKLLDIQNRYRAENQDKTFEKKQKLQELQYKSFDIGSKIADKEALINNNVKSMTSLEKSCETLRNQWHESNKEQFEFSAETVCPTCGQALPEEQVQTAIDKAQADFNLKKSRRLESINQAGKKAKQSSEELKSKNADLQVEIDKLTIEKETIEKSISTIQFEIDSMTAESVPSIENNIEYQKAIQEKTAIQNQIKGLNDKKQDVICQLQTEVGLFNQDISSRERNLALIDSYERGKNRIQELKDQEKYLSSEYENLASQIYLTEQFIRSKVNMLEERINGKFKMARFKLFDVQINGGVNECCETLYQGVPYSGGLNNAARINVGLDIINTLSEHYKFMAPIFVDNREAVTELIETKGQVVSLVVSAQDKILRVEYGRQALKEAV